MSLNVSQTLTESVVAQARPEDVIYFPDGLVGCEDWKRFVLVVEDSEDLPVALLQNVDNETVGLMVTDPTVVVPGYSARLTAEQRSFLELNAGDTPVQYCTLCVDDDGSIAANLMGPLVINPVTRRGLQLVLSDSAYSTRHPVGPQAGNGTATCSS